MNYLKFMETHDKWKKHNPDPLQIEIEVTDYREVPIKFLTIDYQSVIDAYKNGQTEIPGLKIWKEEP